MGPISTFICQSHGHTRSMIISYSKNTLHHTLCNIIYVSMYKHLMFITFTTRGQELGNQSEVPKCHVVVYVDEAQRKRFLDPVSFLNHPSFQELLLRAGEEYGFEHPTGRPTIPCREEASIDLATQLHGLCSFSRSCGEDNPSFHHFFSFFFPFPSRCWHKMRSYRVTQNHHLI
ncbi:hypothetical protein BT93_I1433 [Corymbia citriodora subsp. variegata]|nr:hypothetical protein BT93_I1433 [Corymbia citriodora subsp. variegata]